MAAAAKNSFL